MGAEGVLPAFVRQDPRRMHITVAENPFGACDGAFVDLGPVLHWWAFVAVELDPAGARELADGLNRWAEREAPRRSATPPPPDPEFTAKLRRCARELEQQ